MAQNAPPGARATLGNFRQFSNAWGNYLDRLMTQYGGVPIDQLPSIGGGHSHGGSVSRAISIAGKYRR
jgi:hypothetical protein